MAVREGGRSYDDVRRSAGSTPHRTYTAADPSRSTPYNINVISMMRNTPQNKIVRTVLYILAVSFSYLVIFQAATGTACQQLISAVKLAC